ncbi:MAG: sigma-70 family RNA polymerase sigma factor [Deltaproteobacteria bacterium]|nr:sigma-70 family RNA polymerase sigma factor [Deltaproteobacteria bacterium]
METASTKVEAAQASAIRHVVPTPDVSDVYRDHFRFVWASLLRMGVPEAAVEDALQDVFIVVHRRLDGWEGRSSLRAWLFGIVRRVAHRYRRGRSRTDRKLQALAQQGPPALDLEAELGERQLWAVLLQALDELDEDKRAAITLHVLEELSGPEVAAMLQINVDTAYSRIKAARRTLRRTLHRWGVREPAEQLVRMSRGHTRPPATARRRVWALLAVRLSRGGTSAVTAASVGTWKGIAAGLAIAGALVVGAVRSGPSTAPPSPSPSQVPVASVSPPDPVRETHGAQREGAPTPEPTVAPAADEAALTERRRPARRGTAVAATRSSRPSEAASDALSAEVEMVARARAAIDQGQTPRALEILHRHAERFPKGQLKIERAAYRAIALCEGGDTIRGRGEARVFVASHPSSSLRARVTDACGLRPRKP